MVPHGVLVQGVALRTGRLVDLVVVDQRDVALIGVFERSLGQRLLLQTGLQDAQAQFGGHRCGLLLHINI